jgi:hypothetical protein
MRTSGSDLYLCCSNHFISLSLPITSASKELSNMYAAVWHRGRQSLGVARFYQHGVGGPVSWTHDCLFRGAIYLPMMAAIFAYTHLAPGEYDGESYLALNFGAEITLLIGIVAALWVIVYLAWMLRRSPCQRLESANERIELTVHPGEWWEVLARAVAFGSGYVLGASNVSFLLVLAVHHEVPVFHLGHGPAHCRFPRSERSGHCCGDERSSCESLESGFANRVVTCGFFSSLACYRFCRGNRRRLVPTRMAGPAGDGRTPLSLLARWSDLDATSGKELN